jgi:hypothetical protein
MGTHHGRNGALYAAITSGGTATPIAFLNEWSVDFSSDKAETTSFGDTTKQYVAGLPDFNGTYSGFYDSATPQLYTAAVDGVARAFYLYPTRTIPTTYWFGTGFFDFSVSTSVGDAVKISGSFVAATASAKAG